MSHIVESEAENYKKEFIVKFRQSLKTYSIFQMVRFILRSVYLFYSLVCDNQNLHN